MPEEVKKTPPKIRTFAGDLDIERKKRSLKTPPIEKVEGAPVPPVKKAAGPSPKMASMAYSAAPKKVVTPVPEKAAPAEAKPIPKPIPKPETPIKATTKIPAFHELKKHQESKQVPEKDIPPEVKKHSDKDKKPTSDKIGLDSTVITDTKSNDFKLFPSIIKSIRTWFKNLSAKRKLKSVPKYTVSDANHRKGVIQKATSKTGTIFTADSETLKEQIRRRQKMAKDDTEAETSWSPYTETGYNLLEAPDNTANVVVEFKKRTTLPVVVSEEPTPWVNTELDTKEKEVEPVATKEDPEPTPWENLEIEIEEEAKSTVDNEPEIPTLLEVTDSTPQTEEVPTTVFDETDEVEVDEQSVEKTQSSSGLLDRFETNTLTVTLVAIIVAFVAIIFIIRALVGWGGDSDINQEQIISAEQILTNSQLVTIPIDSSNLTQLPQLIKAAVATAPTGFVELPIISPDGNEVLASYLFETLQFHVAPALRQSITSARFVTVSQSDPAIIIQFVDRDTVLGGMLSWEETMATDMKNIYSVPNEITSTFTDKSLGGIDVRILIVGEEEILVYGFIGGNTLLIAPNTNIFTQLSQPKFNN